MISKENQLNKAFTLQIKSDMGSKSEQMTDKKNEIK